LLQPIKGQCYAEKNHRCTSVDRHAIAANPRQTAVQRAAFLEIVTHTAPQHFQASDVPLIARYAEALTLAERAAKELRGEAAVLNGKPNPWLHVQEKALRAIVALSMRLQLSPQSRRPHSSAPKLVAPASAYEMMDDDE
jgi:hypothetical protein